MKSWDFTPKRRPPRQDLLTMILVIIALDLASILVIALVERYL